MIEILFIKVPSKIDEHVFNSLISNVSKEKQQTLFRYVNVKDAYRSLLGELLVRKYLIQILNIPNEKISFRKNEYGKPFVDFGIHFNISHSGDWVACAISNYPVGIDIERISEIDIKIAEQFFHENEYIWLLSKEQNSQVASFFELWTIKESYIKAIGKGMHIPIHSFWIDKKQIQTVIYKQGKKEPVTIYELELIEGYKLSCCSLFPSAMDLSIATLQVEELCNLFLYSTFSENNNF
ncbi:4'-phosphopantetheinyl transferase superfamily protein [Aneurinibacillus aneurinilyticus]|uniref:4'-phosphopantetheinyl transferase Gsp n=1 Tax=Aneurinibacillus aneurinilyticus TaxID=1391 RepID=UPI002E246A46|nr:4'-phosphopantetheinyl transferase Gsp [Aneurinibacillus aneurinilyticus]MED0669612.1 4'-phosphopantetheinyl transferase superfamily protein [Aneurinibacillus aneurinilyticus]